MLKPPTRLTISHCYTRNGCVVRCGFEGWSGQRGSSGEVPLLLDVRHLHAWLEARTSKGDGFPVDWALGSPKRRLCCWLMWFIIIYMYNLNTICIYIYIYHIYIIFIIYIYRYIYTHIIYILIPESSKPHKPTAWRMDLINQRGWSHWTGIIPYKKSLRCIIFIHNKTLLCFHSIP